MSSEPLVVPCLLALLGLAVLSEAALAALFARAGGDGPYARLLGAEVRDRHVVGAAVCAASVVLALAVATAGEWALPLCGVPLLLAQLAVRRRAAGREADRQTVASLARATEIAGYTPPGHARRVARLGRAVGRELGLPDRALAVIEDAALLHDVGQLSLVDPYPAGATEPLPAPEAQRIARLGGAVVRQTGMPAEVADAVERQAAPYREQPLPARVIRVVNAYADLTGDPGAPPRGARCRRGARGGGWGARGRCGGCGSGRSGSTTRRWWPRWPGWCVATPTPDTVLRNSPSAKRMCTAVRPARWRGGREAGRPLSQPVGNERGPELGMVGCGAGGVAAQASGKESSSAHAAPTQSQGPG